MYATTLAYPNPLRLCVKVITIVSGVRRLRDRAILAVLLGCGLQTRVVFTSFRFLDRGQTKRERAMSVPRVK
jgi:hypothetical protein